MIGQTNQDVSGSAQPRNFATAANQAAPAEHDGTADHMLLRLNRAAAKPIPNIKRLADARALAAHVERRQRLATQARVEDPSRTAEEIEARLEQFGA